DRLVDAGWRCIPAFDGRAVEVQDLGDVVLRLRIRRDPAILHDGLLAGVVGRQREREDVGEAVDQAAQVPPAALEVLARIERVPYPQRGGRGRRGLQQPLAAPGRDRARI